MVIKSAGQQRNFLQSTAQVPKYEGVSSQNVVRLPKMVARKLQAIPDNFQFYKVFENLGFSE